jgi:hypothetical protein
LGTSIKEGGGNMENLFDVYDVIDGFLEAEELAEEEKELQKQLDELDFVPADKEPFHYWDGDYDEETDRDLLPFDEYEDL